MYKIITTHPGRNGLTASRHELHTHTHRAMMEALILLVGQAVEANSGFVFMADTGAACPGIKYDNGTMVEVTRVQRDG